jgi:predicted ABC-type ATPase
MKQAHRFVCVDSASTSIKRVTQRAYLGGHSGSEETIREIRQKSLGNFPRVLDELGRTVNFLNVYDNSVFGMPPRLIASFQDRKILSLDPQLPSWLTRALKQTPISTKNLLAFFQQQRPLP